VTGAGSAAAAVFELTLAALCRLVTIVRAPRGFRHLLGAAVDPLAPATLLSAARVAHLLRILDDHPGGWAGRSWDGLLEQALATAVERLRDAHGPDPAAWAWGRVRPLRLRHPFSGRRGMAGAFDLGPFPWGGATHTPSAAAVSVLDPLGNPELVAVTRFSVEAGDWEGARFVLPGGQSGNPCSSHYDDQLALWRRGEGIPIAWGEERIADVTIETLELADGR
jgi:penicillin amidase